VAVFQQMLIFTLLVMAGPTWSPIPGHFAYRQKAPAVAGAFAVSRLWCL